MQGVGGLEHGRPPAGAAIGQQQRLQHLVGAVGGEHPGGGDVVEIGDRAPEPARGAVGVAMPLHVGHGGGHRRPKRRWGRFGALVGVQPHVDIELGRVVAVHEGDVVAGSDAFGGHGDPSPRRIRIDSACAASPSASARATT